MPIEPGVRRAPLTDAQVVKRPKLHEWTLARIDADTRGIYAAVLRGRAFETVLYKLGTTALEEAYRKKAPDILTPAFDRWALSRGTPVEDLPAAREEQMMRALAHDVKTAKGIYHNNGTKGVKEAQKSHALTDKDAAEVYEAAGAESLRVQIRREKERAADLAHKLGLH